MDLIFIDIVGVGVDWLDSVVVLVDYIVILVMFLMIDFKVGI